MKVILEFDDFNPKPEVNCINIIDKLVELFPAIKLTLFTSPLYERVALFSDEKWCSRVRTHINNNNVRLAVHGLYHFPEEFKLKSYNDAKLSIIIAESVFTASELPFIKVFRGPQWGINENTYKALIDLKYKFIYSHETYRDLGNKFPHITSVYYNWNLKDNFQLDTNSIIIGHGHTHNVCGNGIVESFERIKSFITEYKPLFYFADEYAD